MEYKDTTIKSVLDYLSWINETNTDEVPSDEGDTITFEDDQKYYRGQSCICWDLKPSVLRGEVYLDENALLKKASLRLWNEISSLHSCLEKMIFFQHYGLSTRLLDVTFNPLVALYMACCDESKYTCNGVVYFGKKNESQNTRIADLTAKYVFEHLLQRYDLDFHDFIDKEGVKVEDFTNPIFILPPINNPRIEAQDGAFVMAPLVEKNKDDKTVLLNRKGLEKTDFFDNRRAVIDKDYKAQIMHELSILGINCGSIYKSIEEKLKAIMIEEKWNINKIKIQNVL